MFSELLFTLVNLTLEDDDLTLVSLGLLAVDSRMGRTNYHQKETLLGQGMGLRVNL